MALTGMIMNFGITAGRPQSVFQPSRALDAPHLIIFAVTEENGTGIPFEFDWRRRC
jgi:hypothetical protein